MCIESIKIKSNFLTSLCWHRVLGIRFFGTVVLVSYANRIILFFNMSVHNCTDQYCLMS